MAIRRTPLELLQSAFPDIPSEEAAEMVNVGEVRTYPPDTILCYENAIASTFYIILEGNVRVSKVIGQNEVRILKSLKAGDFFGEMALIQNTPRAATVTTTTPVKVLEIRKEAFDSLLRRSAGISLTMVREVSRRLRENDAMAIEDLRLKSSELATAYQRLAEQDYTRRQYLRKSADALNASLAKARAILAKIQEANAQDDKLNLALEALAGSFQQINLSINQMLFFQNLDLFLNDFQPVDILDVLKEAVNRNSAIVNRKQVRIQFQSPVSIRPIPGDRASLVEAFATLLESALVFSPANEEIRLTCEPDTSRVLISFKNKGTGPLPAATPYMLDRSSYLDQEGGGIIDELRWGLPLARQVIEYHGGELTMESGEGRGGIFSIRFNVA